VSKETYTIPNLLQREDVIYVSSSPTYVSKIATGRKTRSLLQHEDVIYGMDGLIRT
jgi:hypothetical protein